MTSKAFKNVTKLNDIFDVKEYGATGDGVTDDTAAIQAALNAGAGKTILFSPGTYLVYALKISANTHVNLGVSTVRRRPTVSGDELIGPFTGNPTVFWTPNTYPPVFYLNGDNIKITNGTIDGNRANDTFGISSTWGGSFAANANRSGILGATAATGASNVTIDGVQFINMVGVAIDLALVGDIYVKNCNEKNAGNLFANISGFDGLSNFSTQGRMWFEKNNTAGNRVNNNVPNVAVLDRKVTMIVTENVFDEIDTAVSGGMKTQDSFNVVVNNNVFLNTYIKPQSAPTFVGESYTLTGNTFYSSAPQTHQTGIDWGGCPYNTVSVTGNSITNGKIFIERSSKDVTVTGNTVRVTLPLTTTANTPLVGGGNNSGPAGKYLFANNIIDGGGFAYHHFYRSPEGIGKTSLVNNHITGCDNAWYFVGAAPSADAEIIIAGNTIDNVRAIGRINIESNYRGITISGNRFLRRDPATPSNWTGSLAPELRVNWGSGTFTLNRFLFLDNYMSSDWPPVAINIGAGSTLSDFTLVNNVLQCYAAGSGASFTFFNAACNITTVRIIGNNAAGDISLPALATITTSYVSGNMIENTGGVWRLVRNTTRKTFDVIGDLSTTIGSAGGASALPATPRGYVNVNVDGTERKIPYYDA